MGQTSEHRGWKCKLRIADLWNDDDLAFTEKRDAERVWVEIWRG